MGNSCTRALFLASPLLVSQLLTHTRTRTDRQVHICTHTHTHTTREPQRPYPILSLVFEYSRGTKNARTHLSIAERNESGAFMSVDLDVVNRVPPMSSFTFDFLHGCVPSISFISASSCSRCSFTPSSNCQREEEFKACSEPMHTCG